MRRFKSNKLRIFILAGTSLIFVILVGVISNVEPKEISGIGLQEIIEVPNYITSSNNKDFCEDFLSSIFDAVEKDADYKIGMLPKDNQLIHDSVTNKCIKSSIAIYSDSHTSNEAYQILIDTNGGIDGAKTIYSNPDNSTIIFENIYTFETIIPISNFDVQTSNIVLKNRLLITEKCNTIVSLYFFMEDIDEPSDNLYAISIKDEELISYSEQILNQIDRKICPVNVGSDLLP